MQVADAVARMRDSDVQKPPGIAEAIDWLAALSCSASRSSTPPRSTARSGRCSSTARTRSWSGREGLDALVAAMISVETIDLDLPALAGAFSRRLHDAGVPVTAERAAAFARALALVRPVSRRRLYWTARGVFVSDRSQVAGVRRGVRAGVRVGGARPRAPRTRRRGRRDRTGAAG